jgi:hypothetical protein
MPDTPSNQNDKTLRLFKDAIEALKTYPDALSAYCAAGHKAFMEQKWLPDRVGTLLFLLKSHKIMLETLKNDYQSTKAADDAEHSAILASRIVLKIAKEDPKELEFFLEAQKRFFHSYNIMLETPLDNIHALHDFISVEIEILENEILRNRAINNADYAFINAIEQALMALEQYPEAQAAFLQAGKNSLEEVSNSELTGSALTAHINIMKAQKEMLNVYDYNANPKFYNVLLESTIPILEGRKAIYARVKDPHIKEVLVQSFINFEENYKKFLQNPMREKQSFNDFLDAEIQKFEVKKQIEPEKIPEDFI